MTLDTEPTLLDEFNAGPTPTPGTPLEALAASPVFKDADVRLLRGLSAKSEMLTVRRNRFIFRSADAANALYVLVRGRVRLILPGCGPASSSPDAGGGRLIGSVYPGQVFGVSSLLKPAYHPLHATAATEVVVLSIPADTLRTLLAQNSWLAQKLMEQSIEGFNRILRDLTSYSRKRAGNRLVQYLLEHMTPTGPNTAVIRLSEAKRAIASTLSITPETLSRELRALREEGLLDVDDEGLRVEDVAALQSRG